jgi:hypothetical protein
MLQRLRQPHDVLGRVAICGLLLAVLSSACGSCLAAISGDLPAPARNSTGHCQPADLPADDGCGCNCPAYVGGSQSDAATAVATLPGSPDFDSPEPTAIPSLLAGQHIDSAIRPGGLPGIARPSPIRSYCVRLE